MCTNGINTGQFEQMIEQIDDHIKLERRWAHNLAHQAEDAGFETAGEKLHAATFARCSTTPKKPWKTTPKKPAA